MALDQQQQARVDKITALLRENTLRTDPARIALSNELAEILSPTASPQVDDKTAALAARADCLNKALTEYRWSPTDRRILAERLSDVLQEMPNGVWMPPVTTASVDPWQRPPAGLPGNIAERLADNRLPADTQQAALADLDTALTRLGPAPSGGEKP
jgi:hypothetical protein